jgi:hypothetical protein
MNIRLINSIKLSVINKNVKKESLNLMSGTLNHLLGSLNRLSRTLYHLSRPLNLNVVGTLNLRVAGPQPKCRDPSPTCRLLY